MNEKHWFSIGIALYGAVTLLMAALAVVQALLGNWGVMALCALSAATWAALMAWTVQDWRTLYSERVRRLAKIRALETTAAHHRAMGEYCGDRAMWADAARHYTAAINALRLAREARENTEGAAN